MSLVYLTAEYQWLCARYSPDATRIAVRSDATIAVRRLSDGHVAGFPCPAHQLAWSPDGRSILYTHEIATVDSPYVGTLWTLDTVTSTQRQLTHQWARVCP